MKEDLSFSLPLFLSLYLSKNYLEMNQKEQYEGKT